MPYRETIRQGARAHGRHKKQTGGRGQFGDCHIEIEPIADPVAEGDFEFVNAIKRRRATAAFLPGACAEGLRRCRRQGTAPSRASR